MQASNEAEIIGKRVPVENLSPGSRICEDMVCESQGLYLSEGSLPGMEEIQAIEKAAVNRVWIDASSDALNRSLDIAPTAAKRRILIVDDMRLIRKTLADMLTANGYNIIGEADDGDTAVELAAKLNPDLIIMDVVMNRMSGIAATSLIKKANPNIKVIIITQTARPSIVTESFKAGAVNFVTKPLNHIQVLRVVRKALSD